MPVYNPHCITRIKPTIVIDIPIHLKRMHMDYTENYLDNNLNLYLPYKFPNKFKSKNSRKRVESLWNKFKKVLGKILKTEFTSAS